MDPEEYRCNLDQKIRPKVVRFIDLIIRYSFTNMNNQQNSDF